MAWMSTHCGDWPGASTVAGAVTPPSGVPKSARVVSTLREASWTCAAGSRVTACGAFSGPGRRHVDVEGVSLRTCRAADGARPMREVVGGCT